jgi:hypothetical protein
MTLETLPRIGSPRMREAIQNCLWLGNAMDARDVAAVLELRIVAVVDLAMEEPPIPFPRDVVYCRIPLVDGSGNRPEIIRAAVDLTASLIDSRVPTLVACGGGMSRSPIIVAAALAKVDGRSLEKALEDITAGVAHDVSTSLWAEIKAVCDAWN